MIRRSLAVFAVVAMLAGSAHAQRQEQVTTTEVVVSVVFDDNNEAPKMCRVQLLTSARMPVAEQFANDRGQATFRVTAGNYLVQTVSMDSEPGEATFTVSPRQSFHTEFLRLKHKPANGGNASSNEGSISTAVLNIPDKA